MTITNGYLTAEEAIAYIGRSEARPTDELEDVITAVSRLIDRYCGRHFWQQTATARTFDSPDGEVIRFGPFNDLVSVTSIKVDDTDDGTYETTLSASSYQLLANDLTTRATAPVTWPYEAVRALGGTTFPTHAGSGRVGLVEITGTWGWPAVPAEVKQAARILTAEVAKLADAPLGVAGFGEFGVVRVASSMPARARHLLDPFRHPLNFGMA